MQHYLVRALALALVATAASAQTSSGPHCRHSASRQLAFAGPSTKDRLTVSIGPGPCHSAKLSFVITSEQGRVLYRYVAPLKRHLVTGWDDPALVADAREFVQNAVAQAVVARENFAEPRPQGKGEEGESELTVPAAAFKRLMASRQPLIYHLTYYEGGQYVAFDPATRSAKVVAKWGV